MKKYKIELEQYEVDALYLVSGRVTHNILYSLSAELYHKTSDLIHLSKAYGIVDITDKTKPVYSMWERCKSDMSDYTKFINDVYINYNKKYIIELTQKELDMIYSISLNTVGSPTRSLRGTMDNIAFDDNIQNIVSKRYDIKGKIYICEIDKRCY